MERKKSQTYKKAIAKREKRWREDNKDHVAAYNSKYKRVRRKNDLQFRLASNLRSRYSNAIAGKICTGSFVRDLGCSIEFLKKYLEERFYDNSNTEEQMSGDNYGMYGWHIDHIIPLSAFDLTDREQFLQACHYTNLQPLWAEENLRKSNRVENCREKY